jgi:DNA-binding winged helix-turn-helix (wHTH) protein
MNCPHCGQPITERHGVKFPPKLCELFDAIKKAGPEGIEKEALMARFWPDKPRYSQRNCLKVNVNHINDLLVATDLVVCAPRFGAYRLVQVEGKRPATRDDWNAMWTRPFHRPELL